MGNRNKQDQPVSTPIPQEPTVAPGQLDPLQMLASRALPAGIEPAPPPAPPGAEAVPVRRARAVMQSAAPPRLDEAQLPAAPKPSPKQTLINKLVNDERKIDEKFHLVLLPPDEQMRSEEFDTIEALVARMAQFNDTPTQVRAFLGSALKVSKPPHRYLITPWGSLPLFGMPDPTKLEIDEGGFMGAVEKKLEAPLFETEQAAAFAKEDAEAAEAEETAECEAAAAPVEAADEDDTPLFVSPETTAKQTA